MPATSEKDASTAPASPIASPVTPEACQYSRRTFGATGRSGDRAAGLRPLIPREKDGRRLIQNWAYMALRSVCAPDGVIIGPDIIQPSSHARQIRPQEG